MTPHGEIFPTTPSTMPLPATPDRSSTPDRSVRYRMAEALGRPPVPELTPEEKREFEALQDRADAEAERLYGPPLPPEAWRR